MNTEITEYSELNTAYAFVFHHCKKAGHTPVGPGITIEESQPYCFQNPLFD